MAKRCQKSALSISPGIRPYARGLPSSPTCDYHDTLQWFAVYTYPKHECAVAERLTSQALEVFYPSLLRESRWKDRKTWIRRPLFPGYVFVRVKTNDRIAIVRAPGVIRIVSSQGIPLAIPDSEIEAVRFCLLAGGDVELHPYVEGGMRVRLTSGPYAGVEGTVNHSSNGCKLVVSVAAIRQAITLEVNSGSLDPVLPEAVVSSPSDVQ